MKNLQKYAALCVMGVTLALVPSVGFAQTVDKTKVEEKKVEIKQLDDAKAVDAEMKNAKTLVLIDFTAAWCGPCQMLKPKLEQLAQEFKGKVVFTKIEQTQAAPGLIGQYGISAFPTVKVFAPGGKELSTKVGNVSINDLRTWIQGELDAFNKAQQKQAQPTPKTP